MRIKQSLLVLVSLLVFSTAGMAYPTLQLDIQGGVYDPVTETIVASSTSFTLYALLKPDSKNTTSDTYYISLAVSPQYGPSGGSLGSFVFNGSTVNVTSDMFYGVPPLELGLLATTDPKDLASHAIFPTYFVEYGFRFDTPALQASGSYNTQTSAGAGPQPGTGMYYKAFTFDISNLSPSHVIHFDLYNSAVKSGDVDVTQFAPFSHDAESGHAPPPPPPPPPPPVPEPQTLLLLGSGLMGLAAARKRLGR